MQRLARKLLGLLYFVKPDPCENQVGLDYGKRVELKAALTLAMFVSPSLFRDDYLIGVQNLEFLKW